MLILYKAPKDKKAFEEHYFNVHIPLAKKLPGLIKYEVNKSAVTMPYNDSDIYFIGSLYFENMEVLQEAFNSPEGKACAADKRVMAPGDDDSKMYLFEIKEV